MLDQDALELLLNHEAPNSLSFYLPTHHAGPEVLEDRILLRNLVAEAEQRLMENHGLRRPDAEALLKPVRDLDEDHPFWQCQMQGLAIFTAPGVFRCIKAPQAFEAHVAIDSRFMMKPLLPLLARDGRYYVIAFNNAQAALYEGSRFGFRRVDDDELPQGVREVMERSNLQPQTGFHVAANTTTGGAAGQGGQSTPHGPKGRTAVAGSWAQPHAAGDSPEDYMKEEVIEYIRRVAKAVDDHLSGSTAPLVIAAPAQLQGHYRQIAHYRRLMPQGIDKNPRDMGEEELHKASFALVGSEFDRERREAVERYVSNRGNATGRASDRLDEIIMGARAGRVDTLFVADDAHCWGRYDFDRDRTEVHGDREQGDQDLLDLAARLTLQNGGQLYATPKGEVPDRAQAAAIFRY